MIGIALDALIIGCIGVLFILLGVVVALFTGFCFIKGTEALFDWLDTISEEDDEEDIE